MEKDNNDKTSLYNFTLELIDKGDDNLPGEQNSTSDCRISIKPAHTTA